MFPRWGHAWACDSWIVVGAFGVMLHVMCAFVQFRQVMLSVGGGVLVFAVVRPCVSWW